MPAQQISPFKRPWFNHFLCTHTAQLCMQGCSQTLNLWWVGKKGTFPHSSSIFSLIFPQFVFIFSLNLVLQMGGLPSWKGPGYTILYAWRDYLNWKGPGYTILYAWRDSLKNHCTSARLVCTYFHSESKDGNENLNLI